MTKYNSLIFNKKNQVSKISVNHLCSNLIRKTLLIFLMEKINTITKSSELTSLLNSHFKKKVNLTRVKLI